MLSRGSRTAKSTEVGRAQLSSRRCVGSLIAGIDNIRGTGTLVLYSQNMLSLRHHFTLAVAVHSSSLCRGRHEQFMEALA